VLRLGVSVRIRLQLGLRLGNVYFTSDILAATDRLKLAYCASSRRFGLVAWRR